MKIQAAEELREFHEFVGEKLSNGEAALSPEEALDQWRLAHPVPDDLTESVSAVRQALADMAAGDKGRPVDEVIEELRVRHNLPK
jgi:hypothetical protein